MEIRLFQNLVICLVAFNRLHFSFIKCLLKQVYNLLLKKNDTFSHIVHHLGFFSEPIAMRYGIASSTMCTCEAAFKFYHILGDNIYDAFSAKYTCKSAFIFHHSVVY